MSSALIDNIADLPIGDVEGPVISVKNVLMLLLIVLVVLLLMSLCLLKLNVGCALWLVELKESVRSRGFG